MKYFIGIPIPKNFKNKIELLRAKFRFFTTEPHITLIPPPSLPHEDTFIKDLIEVCKNARPFNIKLHNLAQFGNRVLYVKVHSPELIALNKNLYEKLNLKRKKREFIPHLTIVKQRPGRIVNIENIRKLSRRVLPPYPEYTIDSLIIYYQPVEKSIYIPYMVIPFGKY